MLQTILKIYRFLFARKCFVRINNLMFRLSLSGLGVLNYESEKVSGEKSFLKNYLSKIERGAVIDVGANVGGYSKMISNINPHLDVYAFEPHPQTFHKLSSNVLGVDKIFPFNLAVGDRSGFLSLYDYENNDGSTHASLFKGVIENLHGQKAVEHKVEVVTLEDFFDTHHIKEIVLLKVDTEGNELNVLRGVQKYLLAGKIRAVHFEFNEMNVASRTYFQDFWTLMSNYDFYRLLPNDLLPIKQYTPLFCEIFAFQNIVAILKSDHHIC